MVAVLGSDRTWWWPYLVVAVLGDAVKQMLNNIAKGDLGNLQRIQTSLARVILRVL